MSDKLQWVQDEINALKEAGLYNRIRTLGSPQGAWLVVDGKRVLNFCSNNYLGLANHPRLVQAAKQAVDQYGVGPAAVRSIAGTMELHCAPGRAAGEVQRRRGQPSHSSRASTPTWLSSLPWWAKTMASSPTS